MVSGSAQATAFSGWRVIPTTRSLLTEAKVAVARKPAVIMHRPWREGAPFRRTHRTPDGYQIPDQDEVRGLPGPRTGQARA